jgi:hypothetical protein
MLQTRLFYQYISIHSLFHYSHKTCCFDLVVLTTSIESIESVLFSTRISNYYIYNYKPFLIFNQDPIKHSIQSLPIHFITPSPFWDVLLRPCQKGCGRSLARSQRSRASEVSARSR